MERAARSSQALYFTGETVCAGTLAFLQVKHRLLLSVREEPLHGRTDAFFKKDLGLKSE